MIAKRFAIVAMVLFSYGSAAMSEATAASVELSNHRQVRVSRDIALHADGVLVGQVYDGQGNGIAGAFIALSNNTKQVVRVKSDEHGKFRVAGLSGGIHQVSIGGQATVCRLWAPRTAPPAAQQGLMLVESADVVRGQCGCGTPVCGSAVCGCGGGVYGRGAGGGGIGAWMANHPILVTGGIAAAIAVPLAVDDDDAPATP